MPENNMKGKIFNPQEVSEVDRALEELKREIDLCGGGIKPPETEGEKQISRVFYYFLGKAQNLVNALEAEKTERAVISKPEPAVDENEQAYYEAISKYAEGIKAHSFYPYEPRKCCSDSKAYADYMSKPEPEINMKEERVEPVGIWKDEAFVRWCDLTDFCNKFEQMQKDINELKKMEENKNNKPNRQAAPQLVK